MGWVTIIPLARSSPGAQAHIRRRASTTSAALLGAVAPSGKVRMSSKPTRVWYPRVAASSMMCHAARPTPWSRRGRSEEHTSELQSQSNLVCRLLLEKKKNTQEGLGGDLVALW